MKHVKYCLLLVLGLVVLTGCNPGSCRGSDPLVGRTRLEPPKTERRPVYVQNRSYGECGVVAGQPLGIPKTPCRPCGTCPTTCPAPTAPVCNPCNTCQSAPPTYSPSSAQTVSRENGGWLPVTPSHEENTTVRGQEPRTIIATEESTPHVTRYPDEEKNEKKLRWVTPQSPTAPVSISPPPKNAVRQSYQSDFSYDSIVPGNKPQTPVPNRTFFTQTFTTTQAPTANTRRDQKKAALAATFEPSNVPQTVVTASPQCTTCDFAPTAKPTNSTGWLVSAPEPQNAKPHSAVGSEVKAPQIAPVPSRPVVETDPGVLDFLSLPEGR